MKIRKTVVVNVVEFFGQDGKITKRSDTDSYIIEIRRPGYAYNYDRDATTKELLDLRGAIEAILAMTGEK